MHYIRLLRPPALVPANGASRNGLPSLSLVLTITTDLGDSFLCPGAPINLVVELQVEADDEVDDEDDEEDAAENGDEENGSQNKRTQPKTHLFSLATTAVGNAKKNKPAQGGDLAWKAGLRVLKLEAALPKEAAAFWNSDDVKKLCIRAANANISATHARQIIYPTESSSGSVGGNGLIMPLWVDVPDAVIHSGELFPHVALRRLEISPDEGNTAAVEVEEEIGESIARHVWDAGLVSVAFLADTCLGKLKSAPKASHNSKKRPHDGDEDDDPHSKETQVSILKTMLRPQKKDDNATLRVLELGSGVGILGIGLAKILHEAAKVADPSAAVDYRGATVLLTDLPEAEERARSNMALLDFAPLDTIRLEYANLDWQDGHLGHFGPGVVASPPQPFDLVMLSDCTYNVDMLPALVGTLSALQTATNQTTQRVLLTKKTRHESEELLFILLKDAGWKMLAGGGHPIRLPVLDDNDEQTIEVFIFERTI
ncbi:hypothetical protein F503_07870 [Ophiostoma piceae UAMH 11346]|uniref:Uncharacterized protein n=1 Tax=Ophiostoma piceae (strain UAMH 11346) TaxID=1262450 RepID=S3C138_OPHP1|nr:hypothetical protein F503_07870 [Ophiostoma piceae UAMH 11346]